MIGIEMAAESINSLLNTFDEELGDTINQIKSNSSGLSPEQKQQFLNEIQSLQNKTRETKMKIKSGQINNNAQAFINNVKAQRNNIAQGGKQSNRRTHRRTRRNQRSRRR